MEHVNCTLESREPSTDTWHYILCPLNVNIPDASIIIDVKCPYCVVVVRPYNNNNNNNSVFIAVHDYSAACVK